MSDKTKKLWRNITEIVLPILFFIGLFYYFWDPSNKNETDIEQSNHYFPGFLEFCEEHNATKCFEIDDLTKLLRGTFTYELQLKSSPEKPIAIPSVEILDIYLEEDGEYFLLISCRFLKQQIFNLRVPAHIREKLLTETKQSKQSSNLFLRRCHIAARLENVELASTAAFEYGNQTAKVIIHGELVSFENESNNRLQN